MSLLELFYDVDTYCVWLPKPLLTATHGQAKRGPKATLCASEIMTILIHFHQSHYRDFKAYYTEHGVKSLACEFPGLVSYTRFVELIPGVVADMTRYLLSRMGKTRGVAFIDSTPLAVCHNKRIFHHKVFDGIAERGKSSLGFFYGFKLHLLVNDQGELRAFMLTPGNTDDRKPVPTLTKGLWGKLFGDKGYHSQPLLEQLLAQGVPFVTPPKKRKKQLETRLLPLMDKLLARKRAIIETINDQLKNVS